MIYLISYNLYCKKVGAWGLRPRQVGVKGDAAVGVGSQTLCLPCRSGMPRTAGKHLAIAEAGIRDAGKHTTKAPEPDREARF